MRRRIALIYSGSGEIKEPRGRRKPIKPLYSSGEAFEIEEVLEPGSYAVQIDLVMNSRRKVKGYITLYKDNGDLAIRAKYSKLKLRLSSGDPKYGSIIERIANHLKIPYKNVNWTPNRPRTRR